MLSAFVLAAVVASSAFEEAEQLSTTREITRARDLYRTAAVSDPDPLRRDKAAIRAAGLDWHVFHDADSARRELGAVQEASTQYAKASLERAAVESELTHDVHAAQDAATRAYAAAATSGDRAAALTARAEAVINEAVRNRLQNVCSDDAQPLTAAIVDLHSAIAVGGPLLGRSRLLIDAGALTGDRQTVLDGWRSYYIERPARLAAAEKALIDATSMRNAASALAASGFFTEAELVLRDPCAKDPMSATDASNDIVSYSRALRRIFAITDEHYRNVARGAPGGDFDATVAAEGKALWTQLSWPRGAPPFSIEAAMAELAKRFGTVAVLGRTDDIPSLLLGHRVVDETRLVAQYGRKASLHFVQLDGDMSAGYMAWVTRGRAGTGGWTNSSGIYQLRPMYADDAAGRWRWIADPAMRTERDREIADESRRDLEKARRQPITNLPGLDLRLARQAAEEVRQAIAATGKTGDALRDEFIATLTRDKFDASIWAHEGRHAIDMSVFHIKDSPELEYRAKLSEIAFARSPRLMSSILSPVGGTTAHGKANERVLRGMTKWMSAHAAAIHGLDRGAPLLPQLDKLSDEQLRAAARSLDPLARRHP